MRQIETGSLLADVLELRGRRCPPYGGIKDAAGYIADDFDILFTRLGRGIRNAAGTSVAGRKGAR